MEVLESPLGSRVKGGPMWSIHRCRCLGIAQCLFAIQEGRGTKRYLRLLRDNYFKSRPNSGRRWTKTLYLVTVDTLVRNDTDRMASINGYTLDFYVGKTLAVPSRGFFVPPPQLKLSQWTIDWKLFGRHTQLFPDEEVIGRHAQQFLHEWLVEQ